MSPEWQLKTLLQMRSHWMKSQKESLRLEEAGLTGDVLDSAISSFILEARIIYLQWIVSLVPYKWPNCSMTWPDDL